MKDIKNFTAAFPKVEKRVKEISLEEFPYFRTNGFDEITLRVKERLTILGGAVGQHELAIYTGTGTASLDAALNNFVRSDDKILVVKGGRFGTLLVEMCNFYRIATCVYEQIPGEDIDLTSLEAFIDKEKPDVLFMQHNETSVMQLYNISKICGLAKQYNLMTIVDACSSFAIDPINVFKDQVDVLLYSSQKGLGVPAGLAFISYNKYLNKYKGSYYLDVDFYNGNAGRFIQPFTPPVTIMYQLLYRLEMIDKMGVSTWFNRISNRAEKFRKQVATLPVKIVAETPSNCGTVFDTGRSDNADFCGRLTKQGIYITNSKGYWGDYLSVGHIGDISENEYDALFKELRLWLNA
ncbi:pyridoxal-phosphate-dependent aminotransferase family protein [Vreelandella arctica]|uniref:pyridoxal-phosphate-dependent aminotransferase family protein n=1 Tax=Vreelandella arctica TaxID=3126499 RepID=UPI00300E1536